MKDYYSILGISRNASPAEIRTAYINRSRILHPDRFDSQKQHKDWELANEMMKELNEAYSVLKDTTSKARYEASFNAANNTGTKSETPQQKHSKKEQEDTARQTSKHSEAKSKKITKEYIEQGYRVKKIGISSKWGIKTHLQEDPRCYTPEAWEYLMVIARENGFTDEEIKEILVSAEKVREQLTTWREFFLRLGFLLVVCIAVIVLALLSNIPGFNAISIIALIILSVWVFGVTWKRGWFRVL